MERALRDGSRMEEPHWMDPDADAVLIATVHASKGLEYLFMDQGVIIESGTPDEVFNRTDNPRTLQFLQKIQKKA